MISEGEIREIIKKKASESDFFIVDVLVKPINKIHVFVDNMQGITIGKCAELSKYVEKTLLEKDLDFEIEVSSPGLDYPFRVKEQYDKNLGKKVIVVDTSGNKFIGILKKATNSFIELEIEEKVTVPGRKKKEVQVKTLKLLLQDIKSTKVFISFK